MNPLTVLEFQYNYRTCDQSDTNQDDPTFTCTAGLTPEAACADADIMRVLCHETNTPSNILYQNNVVPFEIFSVENGGSTLPTSLTCTTRLPGSNGGDYCQKVTFDTSGTVDLGLTDKFGSLELTSCTNNQGTESGCYIDIIYNYTLSNVGFIEMDITEFVRTYDKLTEEDLIGLVPDGTNPLDVGQSVSIPENKTIYVCTDTEFEVEVYVEADPPGDINCNDTDVYVFEIDFLEPCDVEVSLSQEEGN